jgi:hypothetical protein
MRKRLALSMIDGLYCTCDIPMSPGFVYITGDIVSATQRTRDCHLSDDRSLLVESPLSPHTHLCKFKKCGSALLNITMSGTVWRARKAPLNAAVFHLFK